MLMQPWADALELLGDTGEVVDFQTARQQIESSLNNYQSDGLEAIDKRDLIQALINKGMTEIELQKLLQ